MKTPIIPVPFTSASGELKKLLGALPEFNLFTGPWLAGGAVRRIYQGKSLQEADIDIFTANKSQQMKFQDHLKQVGKLVHESSAAKSYEVPVDGITFKVQLIHRNQYDNCIQLMKDFDFTVCQLVSDGSNIAYADGALEDINEGKLRFAVEGRVTPKNMARRAMKYLLYGFQPVQENFLSMITTKVLPITNYYHISEGDDYTGDCEDVATWVSSANSY